VVVVPLPVPESVIVTPEFVGPETFPEMVQFDAQLGAMMVIVELIVLVSPLASVTLIVTVWFAPALVGVPCTLTVLVVPLERDSPGGRVVPTQAYGPTPPFTVTGEL
jgi:hypothetical protein